MAAIQRVEENAISKSLLINWANGDYQTYPYVWLRDNCQCYEICWNPNGQQIKPSGRMNLDVEVTPIRLQITDATCPSSIALTIDWSDGHNSRFQSDWLRRYRFDQSATDSVFDPKLRYWGSNVTETQLQAFQFQELLDSDTSLCQWLIELKELGIAIIKGTPRKEGQLNRIGKRVSLLHASHYGHIFKVESRPNTSDSGVVTYQSGYLPLHTDLSYYQRPPEIMMLHCIEQVTEGGESILADGFNAAEELKRTNPEAFKSLTSTVFEYFDIGDKTDYHGQYNHVARHPIIRLDDTGHVACVCFSPHARDAMLRIPVSEVLPAYRAMKAFIDILYDPKNLLKYKMEQGDIVCINNLRTLHGRTDFTPTATTNRHLEGAYLEWDQANSRLRCCKQNRSTMVNQKKGQVSSN